ncbi:MAG: tRNA-binding protein [Candidatus Altiarchaeota archaeon]|nr:tRNA-binding protein [Candidatus Altiarchaeota archaeon]
MPDWNDYNALEIRVGTIIQAENFEGTKKPAYKLLIDLGDFGKKKSSAQITDLYEIDDLIGRQVICVAGFPKKQIKNFISEVLVTGFITKSGVVLVGPDTKVKNGLRLL